MTNVILFHKKNPEPLGYAETVRQNLDPIFFFGVLTTFVLPPIISYSSYGALFALLSGACALVGTIWGIVIYLRFPHQIDRCVPTVTAQAPSSEVDLRRAA